MELFSGISTPLGALALALALGVVFVNGWTDAPNSIATAVATGALSMNKACVLSAICNLVGLGAMSLVNMRVAKSVFESADFGEKREVALVAVFASTIIFALASWLFSMPSSESHALLASIAGASLALSSSFNITPFFKIILYMVASCIASLFISFLIHKALQRLTLPYKRLQIASCAISSAMHGAQDGQKLVGILLFLCPSAGDTSPTSIIIMVSIVLFLGTLLGGGRIVKTMGEGITRLRAKSAFISELSAGLCLCICSLLGYPVSTSNIKACSVAGAGICDGESISYKTLVKMAYVAILTIPICMAMGYALTRLLG